MRELRKIAIGILIIQILLINFIDAQETKGDITEFIKISGYVKNDFYFDTRQTVSAREGFFLLYPCKEQLDKDGKDINAKSNFNMLAIQSMLSFKITGPDAFGAKSSGVIEGDFFAQANDNINLFRLKNAYFRLKWTNTDLLFGQYWHPLFVTSCYPATISFNTGSPIQPFSRAPQIRLTQAFGKFDLIGAVLSQRDYRSVGLDGVDSKYLRNSNLPELQFQISYNSNKSSEGNQLIIGTGIGYKKLVPQIKTYLNYSTDASVNGSSVIGYLKYKTTPLTFKIEGIYLENGSEFLNISGYAIKDTIDFEKGILNYAPIRTYSIWTDIQTNGKKFQVGLFAGYTENLGTKDKINGPLYLTSDANIKNLYRISPRISFISNKTTLALETEYTSAAYGNPDNHALMINTVRVNNIRILFSAIYNF